MKISLLPTSTVADSFLMFVPIFSLLGDTITILEDRGLFETLSWFVDPDVGAILVDHQNLHYNISYVNDTDVNGTVWTFNSDPQIMNDYYLNFQVYLWAMLSLIHLLIISLSGSIVSS